LAILEAIWSHWFFRTAHAHAPTG